MTRTTQSAALSKNHTFLALWWGQLVSNLGDKLLQINAMGCALAAAHAAGGAMAQALIWSTIPFLCFGLFAGVVVDRANRQHVMVASDLVRAALLAFLPIAAHAGWWAVCLVIALVACATCFFNPARTALIPTTVTPQQLVTANAWFAASSFVVALVGTVLGSLFLVWFGLTVSLWINAGVFGLSALVIALAKIRVVRPAGTPFTFAQAKRELHEGLRIITRHGAVRAYIAHYALIMALAAAGYVGLVGYAGGHGGLGLQGAALLLTAAVCGVVAGGVLVHRLSRRLAPAQLMMIGLGGLALGAVGVASSTSTTAMVLWLVCLGAGAACYVSIVEATIQRIVPERSCGRVIAARSVVSSVTVLVASFGAGWLIDHVGKAVLFGGIAGLAFVALTLVWLIAAGGIYWCTRAFFRTLALAYLRLDVQGLERIPQEGGVILAGNHPDVIDGVLLFVVAPRPVRFLIAEEMYTHRYLHWLFKALGFIPVWRRTTHNGEALRSAVAALKRGEVLGIFPEGTTYYRGSMEQLKPGVAILAHRTGAPVVPLGIEGSYAVLPPQVRIPRPRLVQMRFGAPRQYPVTQAMPIPSEQLSQTLRRIHMSICRMVPRPLTTPQPFPFLRAAVKGLQIACAALIVCPLTGFLVQTANPSLDPAARQALCR